MSLKILWVTPWFPSSPEDQQGSYIWDAIQALRASGNEVDILLTQSWRPKRNVIHFSQFPADIKIIVKRPLSIPRHYFRALSNWIYLHTLTSLIQKMLRQSHYDVIHAHTEICGIAAVHAGKKMHVPTVVTVHGIDTCPRMWRGHAGRMIDRTLIQADRVVMVGQPLAEHFGQRLPKSDHFRIVYNGFRFSPTLLSLPQNIWSEPLRLISVSNLVEGKGIDITIRALAELSRQGIKNWSLTIIGDGNERKKLEELVVTLGLSHHIQFMGACSHDKVYQHLLSSDVFCLPSYREAFGIVYLEAMAHGLLTLAVKGQGAQTFIQHEQTGLLMEPEDVQDLAFLLKRVFTEQTSMQKIAERGREFVLKHFTWKHHAEALVKVYQEVVK